MSREILNVRAGKYIAQAMSDTSEDRMVVLLARRLRLISPEGYERFLRFAMKSLQAAELALGVEQEQPTVLDLTSEDSVSD